MPGAVFADVVNGFIKPVHDLDIQFQAEPFLVEVRVRDGGILFAFHAGRGKDGHRAGFGHHDDAVFGKVIAELRQDVRRDLLMNQQRLQCIAYRRALYLGVADEGEGLLEVGGLIQEDMADADPAGNDRDAAVLAAEFMQSGAAAGDEHVDVLIHLQQLIHQRTVRRENALHRVLGEAGRLQRIMDSVHQRLVGADGLFAAAQNGGVAGLHQQGGGINRDIRAGFINHRDNAERRAFFMDLQPLRMGHFIKAFADRVRELRDMTDIADDAVNAGVVQQQTVAHGRRQRGCGVIIFLVRGKNGSAFRVQSVGKLQQEGVLLFR